MAFLVAMDRNGLIGKENALPWHLPADLRYFKRVTMGHPIVMGRKTFESIGKPLPGRQNIILTHNTEYSAEGCKVFHHPEEIMMYLTDTPLWFVIGGAGVFKSFSPFVDQLYLTRIHAEFTGDTYFDFNPADWQLVSKKMGTVDDQNRYPHEFLIYNKSLKREED
ncbi:dihydrofolate reductase [Pullulanibacillus camelliae]|uniref:Dihydrofolate reductase n=2 Tax=Pullulanibacillus camelliae TaxID=1707096 RepID=A0A8J2YH11_9BACL|nr:dihydrofolate reductase [Pullulanibacillus camelliae]